jgi:hypothetical protein
VNIGEALVLCPFWCSQCSALTSVSGCCGSVGVRVALGILAVGVWWAWDAYQSHVEQAATAKHRAAADACVKRLTGVALNATPDTLPVDWFATVDACEKNSEMPRAVPEYQRLACETTLKMQPATTDRIIQLLRYTVEKL